MLSISLAPPLAVLVVLAAAFSLGLTLQSSPDKEEQKVKRAVQDYLEALYECKPELIERSVHKDLTKIGFWRRETSEPYQAGKMTYEALYELAGKWNKDGSKVTADSPREIKILDMMDQTAVARLDAQWGVDYMHLAKMDGKWKILHVLWQIYPPKASGAR